MAKIYLNKLECIATAGSGADDTYAIINVDGKKYRWPKKGDHEMERGEIGYIKKEFEFNRTLKIELWEADTFSDDRMGSYTFKASGNGSGFATIENPDEGSEYKLEYEYIGENVKDVTIKMAKCVKVASGIDMEVLKEVMSMSSDVAKSAGNILGNVNNPKAKVISEALKAGADVLNKVPGLAKAIDDAGGYPDQLYLTHTNQPGVKNRFWPTSDYYEVRSGQIIRFDELTFPLTAPVDINFWEYDWSSPDDHLGCCSIEVDQPVGLHTEVITNKQEGAVYILIYEVKERNA